MENTLIVPQDYDILSSWVNEINGNDSEMESMQMGFKRDNKTIVAYMVVDKGQKHSCIGDVIIYTGKTEKLYIESIGTFGPGMYLFEYNYRYALDIAKSHRKDIVGAIISLDSVLDFTDGSGIKLFQANEEIFKNYLSQLLQEYQNKMQSLKILTQKHIRNVIVKYRDLLQII